MSGVRVTPWQDGDPVPPELLQGIQARRPDGKLIGIDRVLLRSFPLAAGWNELLRRVRAEFSLELQYLELIMLRVAVLNGAEFEWLVHHPAYLSAGGTEAKCCAAPAKDDLGCMVRMLGTNRCGRHPVRVAIPHRTHP